MGIGKKISQRKVELDIKTNIELAERMKGKVHPNTIGKWIAGKSSPRGDNVIALAKALKVTADLLLFDEGDNPEKTKALERMVSSIVKAEIQKSSKDIIVGSEWLHFPKCDKIPEEDKQSLLRQVRNLLKLYKCPEIEK